MSVERLYIGKSSVALKEPVFIKGSGSIGGTKEGEGPLGKDIDLVGEDDLFGCKSWEESESTLQRDAVYIALSKAKLKPEDMRYIVAGDLLGQGIATSFGIMNYEIPLIGIYGACSTCAEGLTVGSMMIAGGFADNVVCVTSSHFASAEKEFRFPLHYGSQRPLSAGWTVTGSGAFVLGGEKNDGARAKITGFTTGRILDYGIKDPQNMGVCMAPAAADTIYRNIEDFGIAPNEYDKIITGDLGTVGQVALIDLMRDKGIDISERHMDCGIEIFDAEKQDTHAGGSGCGCAAVTLSALILKNIENNIWKKVLFVSTGALHSKTSFNEGSSVPGIAHGVVIEKI